MTDRDREGQLTLPGLPGPRRRRRLAPVPVADRLPVAVVAVDRPQPHLDRPFEYAVPRTLDETAEPGVRVKVRFGGKDVDGVLLERRAEAEHQGELTALRKVVSPEVVLTPQTAALVGAVARHYAGSFADVLRLAVPPRHARTENEDWTPAVEPATPGEQDSTTVTSPAPATVGGVPDSGPWAAYTGGEAFLRRVMDGQAPRAVWSAVPDAGQPWELHVAHAVVAARTAGRGALVVLPSSAQVDRLEAALQALGVAAWRPGTRGGWVRLMAEDGPSVRYRAFLAAGRGAADVVIGTRAAAFAPVRRLGLVVCWDELDHLHAEPRAPYPHVREVLALRSSREGCALLVGGYARSAAVQRWVASGWAHALGVPRAGLRAVAPRVRALTSVELAAEGPAAAARLPGQAWRTIRAALEDGPVLVQVPRAGYLPGVACSRCRAPARCPACHGPLSLHGRDATPQCRWCGHLAGAWRCAECSGTGLRSTRVGSERTAEELGRAFPGVPVVVSGASAAGGVVAEVGSRSALVVATPGAEPVPVGGYAAAVLLDAALVTSRTELDVAEQALRTWMAAARLVRPGAQGGQVLLVGDAAPTPSQALVRWDPAWLAERELTERSELALPPAVHVVAVEGPRAIVESLVRQLTLPPGCTVLGPHVLPRSQDHQDAPAVLDPEALRQVRALVRGPWEVAHDLTHAVRAAVVTRSARREAASLKVQVDPVHLV